MLVLGIETTCDETGVSIVEKGQRILSNKVHSSSDIHAQYGGVFPELACRRHIDALIPTIEEALKEAKVTPEQIDLIAVAKGPGLIGALLIGLNAAKSLSIAWNKPFIGINHVEAHLYAAMMNAPRLFPALGLVLSGGHTLLLKILDVGRYERLGTTVDDALGEAFDKVASLLGLPYPGGPHIEALARLGTPRFPLKAGAVKQNPFDFSFSGLKTSVLYALKGPNATKKAPSLLTPEEQCDLAASFQEAAFSDLIHKTSLALPTRALYFGGGVTCNETLRSRFQTAFPDLPLFFPERALCVDNAAMIAGLAYHKFCASPKSDPLDLIPLAKIPFYEV